MRCSSRLGACTTAAAHGVKVSSGRETTRLYSAHHPVPDDSIGSNRALSHFSASVSGRTPSVPPLRRRRRPPPIVSSSIFNPPPFNPAQLTVQYATGACSTLPGPPAPRRYTLTHNDITGALSLTIGQDYNEPQISGFYTRLLRDEVTAEWLHDGFPSLHIYCHISGEERWLAPPQLRDYIFRRELPLVLDTFLHADRHYLREHSKLRSAFVYVHFHSHVPELNQLECWGMLGDRSTWQQIPTSLLQRAWLSVIGLAQLAPPRQEADGGAACEQACSLEAQLTESGAADAAAGGDASRHSTSSSGADAPSAAVGAAACPAAEAAAARPVPAAAGMVARSVAQREGARAGAGGGGSSSRGAPGYSTASSSAPGVMEGGRAVFADDPELLAAATAELDLAGLGSSSSSSGNGSSNGSSSGSGNGSSNGSGNGGLVTPGTSTNGHPSGGVAGSSNGNGNGVVGVGGRATAEAGVGVGVAPDRTAASVLGVSQGPGLEGEGAAWRCVEVPCMTQRPAHRSQR